MREIVLDTETTGLDPAKGDRLVEVAGLELLNHVPTGERFQRYVNPQRDVPEEAFRIHGLDAAFLAGHPVFAEIAGELMEFLGDARLVIHNAEFDIRFLDAELARLEHPPIDRSRVVDTLALARRRFPGAQASLDALCRRFDIDASARTLHGALLDCELLAEVYLQLCGGRQPGLELVQGRGPEVEASRVGRPPRPPRAHAPSPEEAAAHDAMLERLEAPLWKQ